MVKALTGKIYLINLSFFVVDKFIFLFSVFKLGQVAEVLL